MRSRMIAVTTGFLLSASQTQLLPVEGYILIAVLLLILWRVHPEPLTQSMFFLGLGVVYSSIFFIYQQQSDLPETFVRTDWLVKGVVKNVKRGNSSVVRFDLFPTDFVAEGHDGELAHTPHKIRLSWYEPSSELSSGDHVALIARLKPPHGSLNPEAFDYEKWLFSRGVNATGYVRKLLNRGDADHSLLTRLRSGINARITFQFQENRTAGLYQAITTGNTNRLVHDDWQVLKQTGTVHLAVISGLHIGFIAAMGWFVGVIITRLFPDLSGAPYLFSVSFGALYLAVSGFGLPAQRAFIMVLVFLVTQWRAFHIDHWTRWWIAVTIVLLVSPTAIFQVGFWLSFAAVALLILFSGAQKDKANLFKLQFYLLLGMLPLYLFIFSGVSLAAPFVNLIAIPLFSILVPILFLHLIFSFLGFDYLSYPLTYISEAFWYSLENIAQFDMSFIKAPLNQDRGLLLIVFIVAISMFRVLGVGRVVGVMLLIPLFLGIGCRQESPTWQAWVYDVGQGLAVLVKQGDYHLLYDTGPSYRSGGAAFERAILPHLTALGIKTIDDLVISHNDNDHAGGRNSVLQHLQVIREFSSDHVLTAKRLKCTTGLGWTVAGVDYRFLHGSEGSSDNDRSCVLLVEAGNCSLLIPGDITAKTEHQIIEKIPHLTWLIASHHGSQTSTSDRLLEKTVPDVVIYSAGYANPFKHPHSNVVSRVEQLGIKQLNTAFDGAIYLQSDLDHECLVTSFRQDRPRLWR